MANDFMTYFRFVLFFLFVQLQFSCASVTSINENDQLTSRVHSRWLALIEKKWDQAYLLETKGYRGSHTVEQYRSSFGHAVTWKKAEVYKVVLDEVSEHALVTVRLTVQMMVPGIGDQETISTFEEDWLKDSGEWWHYKKEPQFK